MNTPETRPTIGFIGTGRMAVALARGIIEAQVCSAEQVVGSDVSPDILQHFSEFCGARTVSDNKQVLEQATTVFLSVKPQNMGDVLKEIHHHVRPDHVLVSIAAGVPIRRFTEVLGNDCRIIRVMPNTPCLVGMSASAFCLGTGAKEEDGRWVEQLLTAVGIAVRVPESMLDAVTGLSGSGPAYIYQIIEAMSDGGVDMGLPRDIATRLAAQTVMGAAKMVLETGLHPGALKDAVTSPGGTTIAGLKVMESAGIRGTMMQAIEAAARRSQELGKPS
ncbi:MAG: pyrroline-5-carboxylate reductase [Planctomycetaceae bacterium]